MVRYEEPEATVTGEASPLERSWCINSTLLICLHLRGCDAAKAQPLWMHIIHIMSDHTEHSSFTYMQSLQQLSQMLPRGCHPSSSSAFLHHHSREGCIVSMHGALCQAVCGIAANTCIMDSRKPWERRM